MKRFLANATFVITTLLAGCGGNEPEPEVPPLVRVALEPARVVVRQTQSVTVRVDTPDLADRDLPADFATDLDEVAGRIDVTTAPCPSGTGSIACRSWTITPGQGSIPGEYLVTVQTQGSRLGTGRSTLHLTVVAAPPPAFGAATAVRAEGESALVINDRGEVFARGDNLYAQVRFGYAQLSFPGEDFYRLVEPQNVTEFVPAPLPQGQRWIGVDLHSASAYALRDDGSGAGTVFAWGNNAAGGLGFPPDPQLEFQTIPREVPGITNARAVSVNTPSATVALLADGRGLSWNNEPQERRLICERVDSAQCIVLTDLVASAGSAHSGLWLRADGGVFHVDGFPHQVVRVPGLSVPIRAIATGKHPFDHHNLALATDGTVWAWTRSSSASAVTPSQVAGLDNVTAIAVDARRPAFGFALRIGGTVWRWQIGAGAPQQIAGISNAIQVADGYVITGDCAVGGALWRIEEDGRAVRVPGFGEGPGCAPVTMVDVEVAVTGDGRIVSAPGAIDCASTCRAAFVQNAELRLHAAPAPGWRFSAWHGEGCSETIVPAAGLSCEAVFVPGGERQLTVRLNGGGSVASEPAGINCPGDCNESYFVDSAVRLRATAAPGYRFSSFGGDGDCADGALAMSASRSCIAIFVPLPAPAAPTGFTASAVPSAVELRWDSGGGAVVRYKLERAGPSGAFETLDSGISGTATGTVDGSAAPNTAYTYRLTAINLSGASAPVTASVTTLGATRAQLTLAVTGSGAVTSAPTGISCTAGGGDCSENYPINTQVVLTATPGAGYRLAAFGGDPDCIDGLVTLSATLACTVSFVQVNGQGWVELGGAPLTTTGVLPTASLAIGAGNVPHAAYVEAIPAGDVARLRVRRFDGSAWQPLGDALNAGSITPASDPSLAFAPDGALHLAWSQGNGIQQNIFVARFNGSAWENVGTPGMPLNYAEGSRATGPSLAFDGSGMPLVAWLENGAVKFKRWTGVAWVPAQGVGSPEGPASSGADRVRLVTYADGVPVLAWAEGPATGRAIKVARDFAFTPLGTQVNAPTNASITHFGVLADRNGPQVPGPTVTWGQGLGPFSILARRWDGSAWIDNASPVVNNDPGALLSFAMARNAAAVVRSSASASLDVASVQVNLRFNLVSWDPLGPPLDSARTAGLRNLVLEMTSDGRPVVAGIRLNASERFELHVYGYFP